MNLAPPYFLLSSFTWQDHSSRQSSAAKTMDKPSDSQRSSRQAKANKKPIKVVYISNPMKVKTTAAKFKGLVQELTGRDSDIADLQSRFSDMEHTDEAAAVADQDAGSTDDSAGRLGFGDGEVYQRQQQQELRVPYGSNETPFDMLDELFNLPIHNDLDSFVPSSAYYESPPMPSITPGAWTQHENEEISNNGGGKRSNDC